MNIAGVLINQEKHEEALEKYEQGIPIYDKEYGSNSVQTAWLMSQIATTLIMQGKYEEAMETLKRCLAIKKKVLEVDHQDSVDTHKLIAMLEKLMK